MADFVIKRNDTRPYLTATLQANGSAYDLTDAAEVKLIMKLDGAPLPKVNSPATIISPTAGTVQYQWTPSDTDTEGDYNAEWEVVDSGGKVLTFPNGGEKDGPEDNYFTIEITEDLG